MRGRPSHTRSRKPTRSAIPARTIELEIEIIGARGDGVARLGDDLVFVPFTVPGDKVTARIESKRGDGLAAQLVDVLAEGPGRVEAPCALFGRCGGCTLQHVSDDLYHEWKRNLVVTALGRAGLGHVPVGPLVRVPPGSRRRAAFTFTRRKGSTILGFNARATHTIIDLDHCLMLEDAIEALLAPLRALLTETVPTSSKDRGGEDGTVTVTLTETGLDVLIEAESRLDLFDRERLAAFAETHDLARLSWKRPGQFVEPVARRRAPLVRFGGIAVEPHPGGFLQPTKGGELAILDVVLAGIGPATHVADLYSGCGSFTFPLAVQGRSVHAVEGEDYPIRALEAAAHAEGLKVTAEVRDLARRPLIAQELKKFQAVIFDPPRAGAAAQAEQLAESGPPRVVAVSCNPATMARDLAILARGGYEIEAVTPIDQFPFAAHVEAVAVLKR